MRVPRFSGSKSDRWIAEPSGPFCRPGKGGQFFRLSGSIVPGRWRQKTPLMHP
jgi:hypothetical protein